MAAVDHTAAVGDALLDSIGPTGRLAVFTHLARSALFLEALQHEALAPFELRFADYSVLRLLDHAPSNRMAPSRLAELVVCTTGGMTKIVDRLERRGLVHRVADPDDRRGVLVALTRRGRSLSRRASDAYVTHRERVLDLLDDDQLATIDDAVSQLLDALERDRRSRE